MFKKNIGERNRYTKWLYSWLSILDEEGMNVLNFEPFEHLRNTYKPVLYAIRHTHSIINERYLFAFINGEDSVLLTAFKEKSTSDYRSAIARAKHIFSILEELA
jgi:hypothetical protein